MSDGLDDIDWSDDYKAPCYDEIGIGSDRAMSTDAKPDVKRYVAPTLYCAEKVTPELIKTVVLATDYDALHTAAQAAARALKFYATREHWMALTKDGDRSVLVALGPHHDGTLNGWTEAQAALADLEKQGVTP
jgi:hypothetical protein